MLSFLLLACEKVDFKTQGELIAEELINEINSENITKCSIYFYVYNGDESWYLEGYSKVEFHISNTFIFVDNRAFNLDQLFSWYTIVDGGEPILRIYFK